MAYTSLNSFTGGNQFLGGDGFLLVYRDRKILLNDLSAFFGFNEDTVFRILGILYLPVHRVRVKDYPTHEAYQVNIDMFTPVQFEFVDYYTEFGLTDSDNERQQLRGKLLQSLTLNFSRSHFEISFEDAKIICRLISERLNILRENLG